MNKWGTLIDENNVLNCNTWDGEQARCIWQNILDKMSLEYEPGGLDWIRQYHTGMEQGIIEAENLYSASCERQDITGVNKAAKMLEAALMDVITAHKKECLNNPILDNARRFKAEIIIDEGECAF